MRKAIIQRLAADPAIEAIVGDRVYGRHGIDGGISRDTTPEAWDADGDLLPSLVVQMETRTTRPDRMGRDVIPAIQVIAIYAVAQHGYDRQEAALRACLASLHNLRGLQPIDDTHMRCAEIRWSEDTGGLLDPALQVPMLASRFAATVTLAINPGA